MGIISMVTKYDVFEIVYKNRAPIKPIEVVKNLNKNEREYHLIHRLLRDLVKEKLLSKTRYGFEINISKKSELLYSLIQYCLKNSINYNLLFDEKLAKFVSVALQKQEITSKDINIHPKTLKKYIEILKKYGLLLPISERPFRVRIFYNIFLNNLLIYFGYKHLVITESSINYIPEIKKELAIFRRLRRKNEKEYKKIVSEFEMSFVHHSLALEGNPITLLDTFKILKDNIIPANLRSIDVDEVKNYQNAILQILKDSSERKPLSLQLVLDYHKMAMRHLPRLAGKIRTTGVMIKGNPYFKVSKPSVLRKELDNLFKKYNEFIKKKKTSVREILTFAVYFHNEFQHIHPFEDGNSRTTRLITFHLLQSKGIPILDIPFGLLDEYLSYTKASKKREDKKLFQNLQKIILYNLRIINQKLRI